MRLLILLLSFLTVSITYYKKKYYLNLLEVQKTLKTINNPLKRIKYLKELNNVSKIDSIKAFSYYNIARIYYVELKEMDSALQFIHKLEKSYTPIDFPELFYKSILYKGKIFDYFNQPEKALQYYEESLKVTDINNNVKGKSYIFNSMAGLFSKQSDTLKALEYYHKAKKNGLLAQRNIAPILNNLGVLHFQKNKDSAIYYFNRALQIDLNYDIKFGQKKSYINLAHAYLRNNNPPDYPKAFKYLQQAEQIGIVNNIKVDDHYINFYYGLYHEKTNNFSQAEKYYQITLEHPQGQKDPVQYIKVLDQVAAFYENHGQYDRSLALHKKYHHLKDSIYSVEKNTAFNTIRTQYEVEKKDQNIALLQKENDLAATRRKWIITTAVLVSLGLIGLFLFYKQRALSQQQLRLREQDLFNTEKDRLQKTKELAEIKALVNGRDKERQRIATELHDGVGGKLGGVHMALSTINHDLKNENLTKIGGFIKESLEEIRTLSHGLSSSYITDKSLQELISILKNDTEERHSITVEVSFFPLDKFENISEELKHHLYRITQELCNNTVKHAHSNHVTLSINKHIDHISYLYEDNGKGFDIAEKEKGIGLHNIEERVNLMNATSRIDSFVGRGTHITIEIPLL
jgi:two-component system NarL family sensor kinase